MRKIKVTSNEVLAFTPFLMKITCTVFYNRSPGTLGKESYVGSTPGLDVVAKRITLASAGN